MSALWNLGFRPFFLFGVAWSVLQIAVWTAFQFGWISTIPLNDPLVWHAHELIYGYVMAIIAGFLLTASQNWTGIPGVKGIPLKVLVLFWGVARILSIFWNEVPVPFALADLIFLPALAFALKPYLWQKSQRQNQVFFLLFLVLFLLNLMVHLHVLGLTVVPARTALHGSVYLTIIVIALIAGRVIPFFSSVVNPGNNPVRHRGVEVLSFFTLAAFAVAATFWEFSPVAAAMAFLAALLHGVRWLLWRPWRSTGIPVLFILYVAYFWVPVGLLLKGAASLGFLSTSVAIHAFTAGCIGTIIYGMITRVALGHTGRPIRPNLAVVLGYWLISLAALGRVFGPLFFPLHSFVAFEISGSLWVLAHLIFLVVYAPMLCGARADGKPG